MELCVGGESIQTADTHLGMHRAVYHGPDWSGLAEDPRLGIYSPGAGPGYVCPLEPSGIKTCAVNCGCSQPASMLTAHDHMDPVINTDTDNLLSSV